eukprot:GHVT01036639.1.p2 GENE.GHVT01036639.1~~GHVT01036639.1.p2  ORF type:complete len:101 (-),score=1.93 GHVT01036639.1:39-341(-)
MSSCKSFRMLTLASEARACWHEELAYSCKDEARHRHRGRQVQEGSLMRCLRSRKDDEGQASLEDNHDNGSTFQTTTHGPLRSHSLLNSYYYRLSLWLRHC